MLATGMMLVSASPASASVNSPTVTGVSPSYGPTTGSTPVTITGTKFTGATAVDFGSTAGTGLNVISDTEIQVTSPAGAGTVDVTVTIPTFGASATSAADYFTYGIPTVSSVSPSAGLLGGGTSVTIYGTGFAGVTAVHFGGTSATSFNFVSPTSITAVSPAGAGTGPVDVTVTNLSGNSAPSSADLFTYGAPTVSYVTPSSGPTGGGTYVTIIGTDFSGTTSVAFGAYPATLVSVVSSSQITAISPAGAGTVDVRVTNTVGTSAASVADHFTYGAPTVNSISPSSGPTGGGTSVTILGTGFVPGFTSVAFGAYGAAVLSVVSTTSITAISPAGVGTVDVTVTTPSGTSATSVADHFTYGAPTVSAVSPSSGPSVGGTTVTITGTGFVPGFTSVAFGAYAGTSVTAVSTTSITAISPAGAGTVDVTATTPSGTSAASVADHFTYGAPTVSAVSPSSGPSVGGTSVTITGTGFVPGLTSVAFGTHVGTSVTAVSATSITAISPAGTGTVDVTVTNPVGTSVTNVADHFTYGAPALIAQAALSLATTNGTVGTPLTLTSRGGSGSGAVTYVVTNAGSAGCAITGNKLSAARAGACNVKVTKAADSTYLVASSPVTKVTLKAKVAPVILRATTVNGYVRVGDTVLVVIVGTGFYSKPTIKSNEAGTNAVVIHDTGGLLVVRVSLRAHAATGSHVFTIILANGHACTVRYIVR
jgi:hypothetical protein